MATLEWGFILSPCASIRLSVSVNFEVYAVTDCELSEVKSFDAIYLSSFEVLFSKLNHICISYKSLSYVEPNYSSVTL